MVLALPKPNTVYKMDIGLVSSRKKTLNSPINSNKTCKNMFPDKECSEWHGTEWTGIGIGSNLMSYPVVKPF